MKGLLGQKLKFWSITELFQIGDTGETWCDCIISVANESSELTFSILHLRYL